MSREYLIYQLLCCIGGSGYGGYGGNLVFDDIYVNFYSGLEYGRNDY